MKHRKAVEPVAKLALSDLKFAGTVAQQCPLKPGGNVADDGQIIKLYPLVERGIAESIVDCHI